MKKTNPNRIPVSMADVNRAKSEATNKAIQYVLLLILYILKDKFGWDDDRISRLHAQFEKTVEMINENRLNINDIKKVLDNEYDLRVEVT